jgi:hypothetical protein
VVVAVVLTPQSIPITPTASGSGSLSRRTTNEQYQCPRLSRYTRTELGADGNSRDHTTGIETLPAKHNRPSLIEKPRVVYSSDGNAFFRVLTTGLPRPFTRNE